jgi:hypothetical protein
MAGIEEGAWSLRGQQLSCWLAQKRRGNRRLATCWKGRWTFDLCASSRYFCPFTTPWARRIPTDYERRGFEAVFRLLQIELKLGEPICFESTGASRHFRWLLGELGQAATVLPIRVIAENAQCLDRIHRRDASIHIPVSDERITQINELAMAVKLPWAAHIDNRGPFDPEAIVRQVSAVLKDAL